MIEKTQSFKTSDGELFTSVEAAQLHELEAFLKDAGIVDGTQNVTIKNISEALLGKKDHIVDLLTMKATSHPKARKANGATRKPRVSVAAKPGVAA